MFFMSYFFFGSCVLWCTWSCLFLPSLRGGLNPREAFGLLRGQFFGLFGEMALMLPWPGCVCGKMSSLQFTLGWLRLNCLDWFLLCLVSGLPLSPVGLPSSLGLERDRFSLCLCVFRLLLLLVLAYFSTVLSFLHLLEI